VILRPSFRVRAKLGARNPYSLILRNYSAGPSDERLVVMDSGLGRTGRPGMTKRQCLRPCAKDAISTRHAPFV
jgi:hypothetical protein